VDGRRLRSVDSAGIVKEWDLYPEASTRIGDVSAIPNDSRYSHSLVISADGEWLAFGCINNQENTVSVTVCDAFGQKATTLKARRRQRELGGEEWYVPRISANGKRVALHRRSPTQVARQQKGVSESPEIPADLTVWDVASARELFHTELDSEPAFSSLLAITQEGASIAFFDKERNAARGRLRVFDVATGREREPIAVEGYMFSACFSPDGKRIAGNLSTAKDPHSPFVASLAVWDIVEGRQVFVSDAGGRNRISAAWSPKGAHLAVWDGTGSLELLDASSGKAIAVLAEPEREATPYLNSTPCFSHDGRRIARVVRSRYTSTTMHIWDTAAGKELLTLPFPAAPGQVESELRFSFDGHHLHCFTAQLRMEGQFAPILEKTRNNQINVMTWNAMPRK
jgi:dipeptidyl aminopeptidase/acylaminoacyl peptidase